MKVRISYVVELDRKLAGALEAHYGREFASMKRSAETLRFFCRGNGEGALDDLEYEQNMREEGSVMS